MQKRVLVAFLTVSDATIQYSAIPRAGLLRSCRVRRPAAGAYTVFERVERFLTGFLSMPVRTCARHGRARARRLGSKASLRSVFITRAEITEREGWKEPKHRRHKTQTKPMILQDAGAALDVVLMPFN
jgi:hypothetical protein